ncbi:hypothetical protein AB833_31365 [Chromatiales bacterium (ex Bugula neritina AB1)]|nr:hypothetical protein AB833_31365 [Chromatiales bacterium (ex Bugula neritina AB1)]
MTKPRKQQISLDTTPFYHCITRCVRHSFLCGFDKLSGRSFEHRRQQIQDDMLRLASVFYIDIAAFCVMSNHYHLVLHARRDDSIADTPRSIVYRAHQIIAGTEVTRKFLKNELIEPWEHEQLNVFVDTWRTRLFNISWFMKFLNEGIARRANKEDDCTGHFWEARYKSQTLLDEKAVLSCTAYVDLNPIRAAMAPTPEQSDHTSIQLRIEYWKNKAAGTGTTDDSEDYQPKSLMPFAGKPRQSMPPGLEFNLIDYIELIDWTGRIIRADKRGSIPDDLPPIIQRIDISPEHWLELATHFEDRFKGMAGSIQSLKTMCANFGLKRMANLASSKLLFG